MTDDETGPVEATGKTGKPTKKRNKPERPRDELGRPQPWDAENRLHLEDYDALSIEENHALGIGHARAGRWFPAHEAWETAWKQARDTNEAELFKGLSQMGAGYVHLFRGNAHGAVTLLRRASGRVGAYPSGTRGLDTGALSARLAQDAARIGAGLMAVGEGATVAPVDV